MVHARRVGRTWELFQVWSSSNMGKDIVTVKLTLGLPSQFMPVPAMGLNYGGANHFCLGKLVLVVVFFSILIIAAGSRFGSMTSFKLIAFVEPEKGYLFL